ncbi:MAG: SURF1 family protein [Alphaproteobacteria bacterium]
MRFRPQLWPTLITVPAVVLCLVLGTWQVQRMGWKEAVIAARTQRAAAPIADIGDIANPDAFEYRRVRAKGVFLHDKERYLAARSLRGNTGYHVLTPLRLDDGGHVLVNRGWVPMAKKDPASRAQGQIDGPVEVIGHLRHSQKPGWLAPENKPSTGMWLWVDLAALGRDMGLPAIKPFFLEQAATDVPGGLPINGQARLELPNDHLQYALTWYAFAVIGTVIYLLYHRRRPGAPSKPGTGA